jgi:hypothetical protein
LIRIIEIKTYRNRRHISHTIFPLEYHSVVCQSDLLHSIEEPPTHHSPPFLYETRAAEAEQTVQSMQVYSPRTSLLCVGLSLSESGLYGVCLEGSGLKRLERRRRRRRRKRWWNRQRTLK